jgi:hypothetical protein
MALNRDDRVPLPGPSIPVIRVDESVNKVVTVLGHAIVGFWTHWTGVRTAPCRNHDEKCDGCARQWPKRWKGYLHVLDHVLGRDGFVEVTPVVAELIRSTLADRVDMRGVRMTLRRSPGGKKGRLLVSFLPDWESPATLPPAKDPELVLLRLWGVTHGIDR